MTLREHIVTLPNVLAQGTPHDLVGWVSKYAMLIEPTGKYGTIEEQDGVRQTMALYGIQEDQHHDKLDARGVLNKGVGSRVVAEFIAGQLLKNFSLTVVSKAMAPSYFVSVESQFSKLFPPSEGSQQILEHTP